MARVSEEAETAQQEKHEKVYREEAIKKQIDFLQRQLDEMHPENVSDIRKFEQKLGDSGMNPDARKEADKVLNRMKQEGKDSHEYGLLYDYLDFVTSLSWKKMDAEDVDLKESEEILDREHYGLKKVKQRIIETIIQINRTHTLPAYGLLLIGPAGTGKSQIAYAVARILKLPWTTLDMSSINDPEQLTGSSRIYANAKPGIIMEAFSMAGESNLVFIINELDKAASGKGNGNPADVLLTLLDNLGFTDNYIECMIPTGGVYPIATANDRLQISAPLMSRFAVIEIPDYTIEEKKVIFSGYALPKVMKRIGMHDHECILTDDGLDAVIDIYKSTSGIRDLEQAAEHNRRQCAVPD